MKNKKIEKKKYKILILFQYSICDFIHCKVSESIMMIKIEKVNTFDFYFTVQIYVSLESLEEKENFLE